MTPSSPGLFLLSISLLVLIIFCLSYCVLVFGVAPCLTLVIRGSQLSHDLASLRLRCKRGVITGFVFLQIAIELCTEKDG